MTDANYEYVGGELDLFAEAEHWKAYWASHLRPLLGSHVLEVGAGIGGSTAALAAGRQRWVCLEPDPVLAARIDERLASSTLPPCCETRIGTLESIPGDERFDSILYIDVLEHIEHDTDELRRAAGHLNPGGRIIVLAPAHQWLFSPFDHAVGHFRRYDAASVLRATPGVLALTECRYLDAVGLLASAANRLMLRSAHPTRRQIALWDRAMVPLSRRLDPVLNHRLGKSILAVWKLRNTA